MLKYIYKKKRNAYLHYSPEKKKKKKQKQKQKSRTELVIKTRSEANYDFSSM